MEEPGNGIYPPTAVLRLCAILPGIAITALCFFSPAGLHAQAWTPRFYNPDINFLTVSMPDSGKCFASGYNTYLRQGYLVYTTDNWHSWHEPDPENVYRFTSAQMLDPTDLYLTAELATGERCFMGSTDGGLTWIKDTMGAVTTYFLNRMHGFCAGGDSLFETIDGAQNWTLHVVPGMNASRIKFFDDSVGYIFGGPVFKTGDGGRSWILKDTHSVADIDFADAQEGIAVGSHGLAIKTSDGGEHWFEIPTGTSYDFNAISYVSATEAVVSAHAHQAAYPYWSGLGRIMRTFDGGGSWWDLNIDYLEDRGVTSLRFFDVFHGFAIGGQMISETTNGGGPLNVDSLTPYAPPAKSGHTANTVLFRWSAGRVGFRYHLEVRGAETSTFPWVGFDSAGIADTSLLVYLPCSAGYFSWQVKQEGLFAGWPAESRWPPPVGFFMDTLNVDIAHLQRRTFEDLAIADSLQSTSPSQVIYQSSPFRGTSVRLRGVCLVPPGILTKNGLTAVLYDSGSGAESWHCITVQCPSDGPAVSFQEMRPGDIVVLTGLIWEFPSGSLFSETRITAKTVSVVGHVNEHIDPLSLTVDTFHRALYPTGETRFSSGEQYEGTLVELHDLRVHSSIDTLTGMFTVIDALGNEMAVADYSRWCTVGGRRDPASQFWTPVNGVIDTIRGIITCSPDVGTLGSVSGYHIAPLHASDIIYNPSSKGIVQGTVASDSAETGVYVPGERGLKGICVTITGKGNAVALTDSLGKFTFGGIDTGSYVVSLNLPAGFLYSYPSSHAYQISVHPRDTVTGVNFGIFYLRNSFVGTVYEDVNINGILDASDSGVAGVLVKLEGTSSKTYTTSADGKYRFSQLPRGEYKISCTYPSGYEQIMPVAASPYILFLNHDGGDTMRPNFSSQRIPLRIKIPVEVRDNSATDVRVISWGIRPGATFGIWGIDPASTVYDFLEGEVGVPPLSYGLFDARLINPNFTYEGFEFGSWTDMRGFSGPAQTSVHVFVFQPGYIQGADYPMRFYWPKALVQQAFAGDVILSDPTGKVIDMKSADSLVVTNPQIWYLTIVAHQPNLPSNLIQRWCLLSLPYREMTSSISELFRSANSSAFAFHPSTGYFIVDTPSQGQGFWVRAIATLDTPGIHGIPAGADTIVLAPGWNLFGGASANLSASDIGVFPPGGLSPYFGYNNGYYMSDSIRRFQGYWVNSDQPRLLILGMHGQGKATGSASLPLSGKILMDPPPYSIEFADAAGRGETLYFTDIESRLPETDRLYDLPPRPPQDAFDVRFQSNRFFESASDTGDRVVPIVVSSAQSPLTVTWHASTRKVCLEVDGKSYSLATDGILHLDGSDHTTALRFTSGNKIPRSFQLFANYPNPFNASTIIRIPLPVESVVRISVYDILGRKIAELTNGLTAAGYHETSWNGETYASGVYFLRMDAYSTTDGKRCFSNTRKMVLIR